MDTNGTKSFIGSTASGQKFFILLQDCNSGHKKPDDTEVSSWQCFLDNVHLGKQELPHQTKEK